MQAVTTARMKQIDEAAIHILGIPSLELMEHAAAAFTGQLTVADIGIPESLLCDSE